jgi:hypothetical protein
MLIANVYVFKYFSMYLHLNAFPIKAFVIDDIKKVFVFKPSIKMENGSTSETESQHYTWQ